MEPADVFRCSYIAPWWLFSFITPTRSYLSYSEKMCPHCIADGFIDDKREIKLP